MSLNGKGLSSVSINGVVSTTNPTEEALLTSVNNQLPSIYSAAAGTSPGWISDTLTAYTLATSTSGYNVITSGNLSGLQPSFPTVSEKLSIASTSALDVDTTGTGARTLLLVGLDANKEPILDIVALAGLTPVLTNIDFLRINRVIVFTAGSTETNAGTIYFSSEAETYTAGVPDNLFYTNIGINGAFTLCAQYTTPANVTSTVIGNFNASTNVSGVKEVELYVESRRNAVGSAWLRTSIIPITNGTSSFSIGGQGTGYTPGTDIRVKAMATAANTKVQIFFGLFHHTTQ